jgi:hypothetical protein
MKTKHTQLTHANLYNLNGEMLRYTECFIRGKLSSAMLTDEQGFTQVQLVKNGEIQNQQALDNIVTASEAMTAEAAASFDMVGQSKREYCAKFGTANE